MFNTMCSKIRNLFRRYYYLLTKKIIVESYPTCGRHDSFWFDGRVASLGNCVLVASGDIRITFLGTPYDSYKNDSAFEEAMRRKLYDADLYDDGYISWDNNNWFEVISDEGDSVMGNVAFTWEDGIDMLIDYYEEGIYENEQ